MAKLVKGVNDLTTLRPDLVIEWNYDKNGDLKPEDVTCGSGKKVWWRCLQKHQWEARIDHRVKGSGCPYCSGRLPIKGKTDLASQNPILAAEWHPTKNGGLTPEDVTSFSNKTVWWRCSENHEWKAIIKSRAKGHGCPYCAGNLAIEGDTDLASQNPFLAAEWHPTKNGDLTPKDVTCGSPKKIWWLGKCGHEWEAVLAARSKGSGCPFCSGRLPIKGKTDLASQNPALASEWHPTRNGALAPEDVSNGSDKKAWWRCSEGHEWEATIRSRTKGNGCPYCSGRRVLPGFNDLASQNPVLALEWHPSKNGDLTPEDVTCHSGKRIWWHCSRGHEWKASVSNRSAGQGCPICSNRKALSGFNDLASLDPSLADEWHPTKNNGLTPNDILCGSGKKVWWHCEMGHEWKESVKNRIKGFGCPYCSGRRILPGFNDLASQNPDLASEWHPFKNGELKPKDVTCGSQKKVWWLAKCGHEWEAVVANREKGSSCPYCSGRLPIKGKTDLASQNSALAAEWHPTMNGDLTPEDVTYGSQKKVWWLGKCGHEWEAVIVNRTNGRGCPYCASSHGEDAVAEVLDNLNVLYLHDKSLKDCYDKAPLRHDFILLSDNKVFATIEYHGQQHYEPVSFGGSEEETKKNFEDGQRRDAIKTQWLKDHNIPQLIIPYWDFDNIEEIVKEFLDSEEVEKSKVSDKDPIYI